MRHSPSKILTVIALFCVLFIGSPATQVQAAVVQFDISGYLNYDAVGTQNEVDANVTADVLTLGAAMGDHNLIFSRAFANQGSLTTPGTALPDDGIIGPYQISTAYDNGTDYLTKSNNVVNLSNNDGNASFEFQLSGAEQGQYSSFNILFVSQRDAFTANGYRSWIVATYTDDTSEIVLDTGLGGTNNTTDEVGGTFGGAGILSNGGFTSTSDGYTFANQAPGTGETVGFENMFTSTYMLGISGSAHAIRTGASNLWQFDNEITLDPTKTLESLTFNSKDGGSNRDQEFYLFAINGTLIPEPGAAALAFSGILVLLAQRRRR